MSMSKEQNRMMRKKDCNSTPFVQLSPAMIEDPPVSFSPFSLADCTMISHFSFNDFVAIAFPDLARDLDTQI